MAYQRRWNKQGPIKGDGKGEAPSVDLDPEILEVMGTEECDPRALLTACFDGLLAMSQTMRPAQVGLNAWSLKIRFPKGATMRRNLEQLYTDFATELAKAGHENFQATGACNFADIRDKLIDLHVFDPLTKAKYLLRYDPNRPAYSGKRAPASCAELL